MSQTYIKRSLEPVLKKAASEFPAVVLTGPRQCGKTTLFQHLFGKSYQYVSLEPLTCAHLLSKIRAVSSSYTRLL